MTDRTLRTPTYAQDLRLQLAASIMDCVAVMESKIPATHKALHCDSYAWGNDRSQMYVDVARMAHEAAVSWLAHGIEGIIYEVSEAIANECIRLHSAIAAAQIEAIIVNLKEGN